MFFYFFQIFLLDSINNNKNDYSQNKNVLKNRKILQSFKKSFEIFLFEYFNRKTNIQSANQQQKVKKIYLNHVVQTYNYE